MDAETINKADAAFNALRPTVEIDFETIATTCAKVIEKASTAEELTDEYRDAVKRANAIMKQAAGAPDDVEKAAVDEELWGYVTKDAEGVELGIAPPSMKVERLAKSWNAEPAPPPADPPVVPEPPQQTDADIVKSLTSMGNLNHYFEPVADETIAD